MKRNLDAQILNFDGKPFDDAPTLGGLCFLAVTAPQEADARLPLDQKLKLFGLAQKVHAGGVTDLSAEDIALLKARAGTSPLSIVAVGRVCELLETDIAETTKPTKGDLAAAIVSGQASAEQVVAHAAAGEYEPKA